MDNKKINLIQSVLNSNLFYDNYEDAKEMKMLLKRYNETDNNSKIGYVSNVVSYGRALSMVHYTDIHGMYRDAERGALMDEYIKNTITDVVDGGDQTESTKEGYHVGGTQEAYMTGENELQVLQETMLKKIGNKIKAACGGNHNDPELAVRKKDTYDNPVAVLYKAMGIPYYSKGVIIVDYIPLYDGKRSVGYAPHVTVLLHCGNGTPSKQLDAANKNFLQGMAVMAQFNKEHGTNFVPDLILGGDYHSNTNLDMRVVREIRNKSGRVTGTYVKTIRTRNGASQKRQNASSYDRSFPATHICNATQYHITANLNKNFDKNGFNYEPEYVFNYTEFEILKRHSNALSTLAEKYSTYRKDEDVSAKAKEIVKNMTNREKSETIFNVLEEKTND